MTKRQNAKNDAVSLKIETKEELAHATGVRSAPLQEQLILQVLHTLRFPGGITEEQRQTNMNSVF